MGEVWCWSQAKKVRRDTSETDLGRETVLCTFAQPLFSPCDSCHPHVLCLCSAHLHNLTHSPCHPSRAVTMTMNCSTPTEHAFRFLGLLEKTLQSPIEHYGHLDLGNKYIFPAVQYTCTLACCGTRSISLESTNSPISNSLKFLCYGWWAVFSQTIFLQSFWC